MGIGTSVAAAVPNPPTAPFDNETNGVETQADFDEFRKAFEETETIVKENANTPEETKGGLGPLYNDTSCVACHQNPVTGSSSQISEIRAGRYGPDPAEPGSLAFFSHPGGSVVHQRATNPAIQDRVLPEDTNRTLRMSLSVLGDGFVECISDVDLLLNQATQVSTKFGDLRGTVVLAPVAITVSTSVERVGRFGWKSQHASLLNFSADAYVNEMGITSPLQPNENPPPNGLPTGDFDPVMDPEDDADSEPFGEDVVKFTRFMRSTKVPPRDETAAQQSDAVEGEKLFKDNQATGCAICHRPDWTTMAEGTPIPGNFPNNVVPQKLAGVTIHPYSDFLLHDVGTGDGIVQTQHAQLPPRGARNAQAIAQLTDPEKGAANPRVAGARANALRGAVEKGLSEKRVLRLFGPGNRGFTGNAARAAEGLKAVDGGNAGAGRAPRAPNAPNAANAAAPAPEQVIGGELVATAPMLRTPPLWGLRVRPQLLHDGTALTIDEAIRRHSGQAEKVKLNYVYVLTPDQRRQLIAFLNSL